jgi:hypothetical protein
MGNPGSINGAIVSGDELNDINSMIVKPDAGYEINYLLGILNSRLITLWFDLTFDKFQRGIFPQFKVKELAEFPIHAVNFSDALEKSRHDRMVELVDRMLKLHKRLAKARAADEKMRLEREIKQTDGQIDRLVYDLYGLTEDEIRIVEEGTRKG